ncbi:hypothetical protein ACFVSQ_09150 [Streptomyces niveus]
MNSSCAQQGIGQRQLVHEAAALGSPKTNTTVSLGGSAGENGPSSDA